MFQGLIHTTNVVFWWSIIQDQSCKILWSFERAGVIFVKDITHAGCVLFQAISISGVWCMLHKPMLVWRYCDYKQGLQLSNNPPWTVCHDEILCDWIWCPSCPLVSLSVPTCLLRSKLKCMVYVPSTVLACEDFAGMKVC